LGGGGGEKQLLKRMQNPKKRGKKVMRKDKQLRTSKFTLFVYFCYVSLDVVDEVVECSLYQMNRGAK
jgi:hypothetical protein